MKVRIPLHKKKTTSETNKQLFNVKYYYMISAYLIFGGPRSLFV